jgi:uncharacterized protein (TIGR00369 family)
MPAGHGSGVGLHSTPKVSEPERSSIDDLVDLFAKDIAEAQLKAHLARTPAERLEWLVQMATFTLEGRRAASREPSLREALGMDRSGLEQLQRMAREDLRPGMGHALALRLVAAEAGTVVLEGTPSAAHLNAIGSIHGGYAATLLDFACGYAVLSVLGPGQGFSTIELKVSYLRPLRTDTGPVRATGKLVKVGRRVAFSEASLTDDHGAVYATASSSLLVTEPTAPATP